VQVTLVTTGADLDADGYTVAVAGLGYGTSGPVDVNGTATFPGFAPGDAHVTLSGVAANCGLTGANPQTVTVPSGGTATVAFDVTCLTAGRIAFAGTDHGNLEIQVGKSNGTGELRLTTQAEVDMEPAWSADGSKVAFRSERDGNAEIYVMNADGSSPVRLTTNPRTAIRRGRRTAPGSRFNRDGNAEIYVMDANGGNVVRITNDPAYDADPAWSPTAAASRSSAAAAIPTTIPSARQCPLDQPDGSGVTR
jgi:hypothetical protein